MEKTKIKNWDRQKIYIYIVPPDAQQVGVSEAIKSLLSSLNSETTLRRDLPELELEPSDWSAPDIFSFLIWQSASRKISLPRLLASPGTKRGQASAVQDVFPLVRGTASGVPPWIQVSKVGIARNSPSGALVLRFASQCVDIPALL